jgi:hypothetical protein
MRLNILFTIELKRQDLVAVVRKQALLFLHPVAFNSRAYKVLLLNQKPRHNDARSQSRCLYRSFAKRIFSVKLFRPQFNPFEELLKTSGLSPLSTLYTYQTHYHQERGNIIENGDQKRHPSSTPVSSVTS